MKHTLTLFFAASCLLFAQEAANQKVVVTHTERADFPAGGLLQVKNSVGELSVEGWDRPDVEITTIKSTQDSYPAAVRAKLSAELDKVKISVEKQDGGLVIATDVPRHHEAPSVAFDVEYRIMAPRNARLAVEHGDGEVHVEDLSSDVQVSVRKGEITLHLPRDGQYGIDARTKIGGIVCDFPGQGKHTRLRLGHQFEQTAAGGHKLDLKVDFGDIIILKMQPPMPSAHTL
jgi:hypothetical protein